jgi:hypothetical protein
VKYGIKLSLIVERRVSRLFLARNEETAKTARAKIRGQDSPFIAINRRRAYPHIL